MEGREPIKGMNEIMEQAIGTEQNPVLFHTSCSRKRPYFTGGFGTKWNGKTIIS